MTTVSYFFFHRELVLFVFAVYFYIYIFFFSIALFSDVVQNVLKSKAKLLLLFSVSREVFCDDVFRILYQNLGSPSSSQKHFLFTQLDFGGTFYVVMYILIYIRISVLRRVTCVLFL